MAAPDDTRSAAHHRETLDEFYARGERAWNEYVRTGVATPVEAVFARVEALIASRRASLLSGDEGAPPR